MTREERLKFCSVCQHRKFSLEKGILCGLTNEYALFQKTCPDFKREQQGRESSEQERSVTEMDKFRNWAHEEFGDLSSFRHTKKNEKFNSRIHAENLPDEITIRFDYKKHIRQTFLFALASAISLSVIVSGIFVDESIPILLFILSSLGLLTSVFAISKVGKLELSTLGICMNKHHFFSWQEIKHTVVIGRNYRKFLLIELNTGRKYSKHLSRFFNYNAKEIAHIIELYKESWKNRA